MSGETPIGQCGPYELLRHLDSGGMGEIFLARGPGPDGPRSLVAIKRLIVQASTDATFVGMFMDEARLATHLDHPHICKIHYLDRSAPQPYLVMEWVDGVSLRALLKRAKKRGGLPFPFVALIIAETCKALHYAHTLHDQTGEPLHIVHRDVSPPNIMIGYDGRVRLLDFGLAKARTQLQKTKPGVLKGKFAYLAPEQLQGTVTPSIDIFALGAIAWEMITGRQLFGAETPHETVRRINDFEGMPRLRDKRADVPASFENVVRRALEPDPAKRYQSAESLRIGLEAILIAQTITVGEEELARYVKRCFPDRPATPDGQGPDGEPASSSISTLVDAPADVVERHPDRRRALWAAVVFVLVTALAAGVTLLVAG